MPHISPKCCCAPGLCDLRGDWYLTFSNWQYPETSSISPIPTSYATAVRCIRYPGDAVTPAGTLANYWYYWSGANLHSQINSILDEPFSITDADADPSWSGYQVIVPLSISPTGTLFIAPGTTTKPASIDFVPYDVTFENLEALIWVNETGGGNWSIYGFILGDVAATGLTLGNLSDDVDWDGASFPVGFRYAHTKHILAIIGPENQVECTFPLSSTTTTNGFITDGAGPTYYPSMFATSLTNSPCFRWPAYRIVAGGDMTAIDKSP